jgi:Zn-dependent peptidase ImmA (M78 family)/O-acetyl-ADP-ribose deacetylase (regulator of RNase III)
MNTARNARKGLLNELELLLRKRGELVPETVEEARRAEQKISSKRFNGAVPAMPATLTKAATSSHARPWTHTSLIALGGTDPIEEIKMRARSTVLDAIEKGWHGPPYDPSELAEILGIQLRPNPDVFDARTKSDSGRFVIEFNPLRPQARLHFSLAHEIVHTLFPDCAEEVRHRATHEQMSGDSWQLEMLCNVGAAEILMPLGIFPSGMELSPKVNTILQLRRKFMVSAEAVLLRLMRLTPHKSFGFAAHRDASGRYQIDYSLGSATLGDLSIPTSGAVLPKSTKAADCIAIGFTDTETDVTFASESWDIDYLGVAPYPGQLIPRVLGIARLPNESAIKSQFSIIRGDATKPRGKELKIICQIVNDKALTWGAGFALAVRKEWPAAQRDFTNWATSRRIEFQLGSVHFSQVREDLLLASLVAQHGYGPSQKPRIRYLALDRALETVASVAREKNASIHLPRIGSGQAGGDWGIVREIIDQRLNAAQLKVTIYDLPNAEVPRAKQPNLFEVDAEQDQFV